MGGREVAELALLVPELGLRTAQCAGAWYDYKEQKNEPKFRSLFASFATNIWDKQESNSKPSARLLSCRSLQ